MQLARVKSYAALGAGAGWVGSTLWVLQARPAQVALSALANIVLAVGGLWLLQTALDVRRAGHFAWGAASGRSWAQGARLLWVL